MPEYIQPNHRVSRYCHSMTFLQVQTSRNLYKYSLFPLGIVQLNALPETVVCLLRSRMQLADCTTLAPRFWLHGVFNSVFILLAAASKTYIGSVLFRTSVYTEAKQASRVPFWFRDLSRQTYHVPGHLVPFFSYNFSGHLVPSVIMGFNSLKLFFYVSKFTF